MEVSPVAALHGRQTNDARLVRLCSPQAPTAAPEFGLWSRAYEQQYQAALAERELYQGANSDPVAGIATVANPDAVSWVNKKQTFQRLRFERLCAYLRHRLPEAEIGCSILVFDLNERELNHALYGPPAELSPEF
jgi:hypothetical protein